MGPAELEIKRSRLPPNQWLCLVLDPLWPANSSSHQADEASLWYNVTACWARPLAKPIGGDPFRPSTERTVARLISAGLAMAFSKLGAKLSAAKTREWWRWWWPDLAPNSGLGLAKLADGLASVVCCCCSPGPLTTACWRRQLCKLPITLLHYNWLHIHLRPSWFDFSVRMRAGAPIQAAGLFMAILNGPHFIPFKIATKLCRLLWSLLLALVLVLLLLADICINTNLTN